MKVVGDSKHKFHVQKLPLPPPPPEKNAVNGIMWKNVLGAARKQMKKGRMQIA